VAAEADRFARGVAGRERGTVADGAVELFNPVRVRDPRELTSTRAGLALGDNARRRLTPERGVDRHVDADPLPLEAARLQQHPSACVRDLDARPDVARDRAGEQHLTRPVVARAGAHRFDEFLAASLALLGRIDGDQCQPARDVLPEPLELQDGRGAFVADDLVGFAEAEVVELVTRELLARHGGGAQRRQCVGCHDSRWRSRNSR
jgi:hypothetical protein